MRYAKKNPGGVEAGTFHVAKWQTLGRPELEKIVSTIFPASPPGQLKNKTPENDGEPSERKRGERKKNNKTPPAN